MNAQEFYKYFEETARFAESLKAIALSETEATPEVERVQKKAIVALAERTKVISDYLQANPDWAEKYGSRRDP